MFFILLRYVPHIPTLVRVILSWMMLNFAKCFVCIFWDDRVAFVFCWCGVSRWLICICWTILVTLRWIQRDHGVWSFLCVVGFGLLIFCWEFLYLYSSRYWPIIFFSDSVFFWFWYQGDGGFIQWIWECSLLFSLLEEFEKDWYNFFFVGLVEFPSWTHLILDFCLQGV